MNKMFDDYQNLNDKNFMQVSRKLILDIANKCGIAALGIYIVIFSHFNNERRDCFPSWDCLLEETQIKSRTTLNKYLSNLVNNGFLIIKSGRSGLNSNYYFPKEPKCEYTKNDFSFMSVIKRRKGKIKDSSAENNNIQINNEKVMEHYQEAVNPNNASYIQESHYQECYAYITNTDIEEVSDMVFAKFLSMKTVRSTVDEYVTKLNDEALDYIFGEDDWGEYDSMKRSVS